MIFWWLRFEKPIVLWLIFTFSNNLVLCVESNILVGSPTPNNRRWIEWRIAGRNEESTSSWRRYRKNRYSSNANENGKTHDYILKKKINSHLGSSEIGRELLRCTKAYSSGWSGFDRTKDRCQSFGLPEIVLG